MAQTYVVVTHYVYMARLELQDLIQPYRYADTTLVRALNRGLAELSRLRPDILLDPIPVAPAQGRHWRRHPRRLYARRNWLR